MLYDIASNIVTTAPRQELQETKQSIAEMEQAALYVVICVRVCVYIYIYIMYNTHVCIYIYIYICIYIHTYYTYAEMEQAAAAAERPLATSPRGQANMKLYDAI